VHFKDLPCRWFADSKQGEKDKPSEVVLRRVFETYGEVRCVDIPMLDPYRKEMTMSAPAFSSVNSFSTFSQNLVFEAFVQYKEYVGFCKAMTSLKGMKMVYKEDGDKIFAASIKVCCVILGGSVLFDHIFSG
jgi:arginine/serine-rich splicing factor 17